MKNINDKILAWINLFAVGFSFADAFEWLLRIIVLITTIVIGLPKFEERCKYYYKRFFGGK